jgi:SNARE protein
MSEEIEVLSDEIDDICKEVDGKLANLKKKRKATRKQKEDMCEEIAQRMARARDVYSTYRIELREVLREYGKAEATKWESRGHDHHKRIQGLVKDVQQQRDQIDAAPLKPEDKDKRDKNTWQAKELIEEGKRVQEKSNVSLAKSVKLISSAEAMGAETAVSLKAQTEQMKSTNQNIAEVDAGINRADKVIKQIGRRIATDKMIVCLILAILLGILGIIIAKATGTMPGSNEPVDCTMPFAQYLAECLQATPAPAPVTAAPASAPAPAPSARAFRPPGAMGEESTTDSEQREARRMRYTLGGIDMGAGAHSDAVRAGATGGDIVIFAKSSRRAGGGGEATIVSGDANSQFWTAPHSEASGRGRDRGPRVLSGRQRLRSDGLAPGAAENSLRQLQERVERVRCVLRRRGCVCLFV